GTSTTLRNSGTITATASIGGGVGYGVQIRQAGSVYNAAGALIQGGRDGIWTNFGGTASVTNLGTVTGTTNIGIALRGGGSVYNSASGVIQGKYGVEVYNATGTVTNLGTI